MISRSVQPFAVNIDYIDKSTLWPGLWKILKEELNLHFTSFKFKNYKNRITSLSSINLQMSPFDVSANDISILTLYIVKYTSIEAFRNEAKLIFVDKLPKNKIIITVLLLEIENSKNGVNAAYKLFKKIQDNLKFNDMTFLPANLEKGNLTEIISDFFTEIKAKICLEINSKLMTLSKNVESLLENKIESKSDLFIYLKQKLSLISYLSITEFWEEIEKLCEDDMFRSYQYFLPLSYTEPNLLLELDANAITGKIEDNTLSNLEYQQFLFTTYLKVCMSLRDFSKISNFFSKLVNELHNFKAYFDSPFHLYFWNYLFLSQAFVFLKNLKCSFYSNYNDERYNSNLINILYTLKKLLKKLEHTTNNNIPTMKQFIEIMDKQKVNVTGETKSEEVSVTHGNVLYFSFLQEVKEKFNESSQPYAIIFKRETFYEEYLQILQHMEKIHLKSNQDKLAVRTKIESIPILFELSRYGIVMSIISEVMIKFQKDKWEYILEYLRLIFLSMYNFIDKDNMDNRSLNVNLLEMINEKFVKLRELKINERIISNLLFSFSPTTNELASFNINNLLQIEIKLFSDENYKNEIQLNSTNIFLVNSHTLHFEMNIRSTSGFDFYFSEIIFIFQDTFNNKEIVCPYFHQDLKFLLASSSIKHKLSVGFDLNASPSNLIIHLRYIKFILKNGMIAIFSNDSNWKVELIMSTLPLAINSTILNQNNTDTQLDKKMLFYNTVYILRIEFRNIPEVIHVRGCTMSVTLKDSGDDAVRIKKIEGMAFSEICGNKIIFYEDKLRLITNESISLDIEFLIEDINYSKEPTIHDIEVTTEFIQSANTNAYVYKQHQEVLFAHVFHICHKARIVRLACILLQNSISFLNRNNIDPQKIYIPYSDNPIESESSHVVNFVSILNLKGNEPQLDTPDLCFQYFVDGQKLIFYYPQTAILQAVKKLLIRRFYIKIISQCTSTVFNETFLKVQIRKYFKEEAVIRIDLKDTSSWAVIGKSKVIEQIPALGVNQEYNETISTFQLIPLKEGYIQIPDIAFHELKTDDNAGYFEDNLQIDFWPINNGLYIEGSNLAIKVSSITQWSPHLKII